MVMQMLQELPAMAALFVCGVIGWCLTRWVNERYASFVTGSDAELQKSQGRRGRRGVKKVVEDAWEPMAEETSAKELVSMPVEVAKTTTKTKAELRRRGRREVKADLRGPAVPTAETSTQASTEADVPVQFEANVAAPPQQCDLQLTALSSEQQPESVKEKIVPSIHLHEDAGLAEQDEEEAQVQTKIPRDDIETGAEDIEVQPQPSIQEEPSVLDVAAETEEPTGVEAVAEKQPPSERVLRLLAKKAARKARKAEEAAKVIAQVEAEEDLPLEKVCNQTSLASTTASGQGSVHEDDASIDDTSSTSAGAPNQSEEDVIEAEERADLIIAADVVGDEKAKQETSLLWGDAVADEDELCLPISIPVKFQDRLSSSVCDDEPSLADVRPPTRRRARKLPQQDGWMASFDDMLVEPREETPAYTENALTFTDGQQIYEPIVGEGGQQLYTDGTTIYTVACVCLAEAENGVASAASVSSPVDVPFHTAPVMDFQATFEMQTAQPESSPAATRFEDIGACFTGGCLDLDSVDDDLEWNACWDFKAPVPSQRW
eukprot:TRINITY_DN3983_c0_g1_i1.p1 TRINITY_DN3983_c0_g1~~TRINITY_DN3983_c0_g1_i1.p1  ORF type:complete len:547 (-),score=135.37 TRINITY_DN3983_c0_g1_i1:135-1775(-)